MKQRLGLLILYWLRFWAKLQLKKYAPDTVGITGSAGKTSCKNAVQSIFKDKYVTKVSHKANSESGIPLDILEIKPKDFSILDWLRMCLLAPWRFLSMWKPHDKYVVEMGIDSNKPPKNMGYLLTIVKPRTAIFLNALPAHTQGFNKGLSDLGAVTQKIAQEKGRLIESLPENGLAILNASDPNVWSFKDKTKAVVMGFGWEKGEDVDVVALDWQLDTKGTIFSFTSADNAYKPVALTLKDYYLPKHYAEVLAAALCVALDEDFTLEEGCELLEKNFALPPSRSSRFEGVHGSTIIDSSYNASPGPLKDMLEMLKTTPGIRKLALLGDMRELGTLTQKAHEEAAIQALHTCDKLFLVGPLMRDFALPICEERDGQGRVRWFATAQLAGEALQAELKKGDVLLVKGSQNEIFLEAAVETLLANKADASRLCRRGKFWETKRKDVDLF